MKTTMLILIFFLPMIHSFPQQPKPKNMKFIPMGSFVILDDTIKRKVSVDAFWMSEEITNREYSEFLSSLKKNPTDSICIIDRNKYRETQNKEEAITCYTYGEILANAIDTMVWKFDKKYEHYFTDKKYEDYPVVGVTFHNAIFYCIWKTNMEIESMKNQDLPYISEYRLPVEMEWEYAACSFAEPESYEISTEIRKVKSGKENYFGLYNLYGNVSEWTMSSTENGERIIKGSSWKLEKRPNERIIVKPDFRDNATGFRIVRSNN